MKKYFRHSPKLSIVIGFILVLSFIFCAGEGRFYKPSVTEAKITPETVISEQEPIIFDKDHPHMKALMNVQERHHHRLMGIPEAVGTAIGVTEDLRAVILVFTKKNIGPGWIPDTLDGVAVVAKVTGEIFALKSSKGTVNSNTAKWSMPVPIGVSTGNIGECSAGTIGARVKDKKGNVYALSNNHVYALESNAAIGSLILQPGLYDTKCVQAGNNEIGKLSNYVLIRFDRSDNIVDAAIALSSTKQLGQATPPGGYGIPNLETSEAKVGLGVKKYGRTSSLTKGTITGINAKINVTYESGTATFVNQIVVRSSKPFIKAGDSGSLLVTNDPNAYPVGLLFAGNGSGTYACANRIQDVLAAFLVTIDGK